MKLSKSLIATVLVLCMLLATMPVMGAVLQEPITELYIPAEGLTLVGGNTGVNGTHWKIILSSKDVAAMGISHSHTGNEAWVNDNGPLNGSAYEGLVLSGSTSMSTSDKGNAIDGAVTQFTFTNVPLSRVSYRNNNGMSFCIDYEDLASGKYISNVKVWDAATQAEVDYDGALTKNNFKYNGSSWCGYTKPTNFRVDRGTWDGYSHFDTGVFPANTIFINAYNLEKTDLATTNEDTHGGILIRRDGKGEFGVFVPKASGSYYVYALRHHHSSGDSDRTSKITVVTTDIVDNAVAEVSKNYVFSGSVGASTATGHSLFWCAPAGEGATSLVDLKAGEPFLIRRNKGGGYDRLAGIAFVPAKADGTNPMSDVADATWTYTNLPKSNEQINLWQKATVTVADLSSSVTVKVNGVDTVVPALAARRIGYDDADNTYAWLKKMDINGDIITFPTVFDALVTATSPVEGNEDGYMPYDTVNDGMGLGYCPTTYSITVNGKLCTRPGMVEIKDGDVIETVANTPSNFMPFAAKMSGDSGTSVIGNFSIASQADNKLQFGFNPEVLNTLGYVADAEDANKNNADLFNGCILGGYVSPRYTSARWGTVASDSSAPFYTESKIYLDFKIQYRGSAGSDKRPYFNPAENERHEYTVKPSKSDALITVGDKVLHKPYVIAETTNTSFDYYGKNMYLFNNQTVPGITVRRSAYNENRVILASGTTNLVTLFIITYGEDGKTITNKEMRNDVYITWSTPYALNINDNQKVFVWETRSLEGTTMKALCDPITVD